MTGDTLTHRGRPVYATTPRALLRDPRISPAAKALWAVLDDHSSPDRPVPWPSQATLAGYLGVTPRTVRSWLRELVAAGWIETRRTGRSNRHVMVWDNQPVEEAGFQEPPPDRKPASARDRKPASGQSGSQLPTKKNQEEEPCEPAARETQEGGSLLPLDAGGDGGWHTPSSRMGLADARAAAARARSKVAG